MKFGRKTDGQELAEKRPKMKSSHWTAIQIREQTKINHLKNSTKEGKCQ